MIEVVDWGIAGSVRDAGRCGRGWLGASRGGAVDAEALALANRLVGNAPDTAGFETSGGLALRMTRPTMLAIAGAMTHVAVDFGPPLGWGSPTVVPAGAVARIGRLHDGARSYVAVRGGLRPDLSIGPDPGTSAAAQPAAPVPVVPPVVRLWPGPRRDWFEESAWDALGTAAFTVTDTSRVGVRLSGPRLMRCVHRELPSEGLVEGAVQVPPDGQPIVMLADHPVTGGYPVMAVVDPSDLHHLAQAPPGLTVRFRPVR